MHSTYLIVRPQLEHYLHKVKKKMQKNDKRKMVNFKPGKKLGADYIATFSPG